MAQKLRTDIARLLKDGKEQTDLVEVFCSPTSTLTKTALSSGLKAEIWTKEDYELPRPSGCQLAMGKLRYLKPKRLWLSPECGPYSIMQNANQRSPQQAEARREKDGGGPSTVAELHSTCMVARRARWYVLY